MTNPSPAAQAVLTAFNNEKGWLFPREIIGSKIAAALRAAANGCDPERLSLTLIHHLHSIADELEKSNG